MKKLLFAVSALAALSLLAPSAGFAQTAHNQLGIYTDQAADPASANVDAAVSTPFNAYLIVTNPWNYEFGQPGSQVSQAVTTIDGFECKINFPTEGTWFKLNETFPVSVIDVGEKPDYVVGFASSVPVTSTATVLCTWQFMVLAPAKYNTYLDITTFPGIAGTMAIVDGDDPAAANLVSVYPSTNDFAVPVLSVNGTDAVSVENESWGGVKALFK